MPDENQPRVVAERARGDSARPRSEPLARRGVIDVTVAGMMPPSGDGASFLRVQQILQLVHELADVAEVAVDRGEAHVRHLVEPLQLLHHERADVGGRDFLLGPLLQRRFDAIGHRLERRDADRPLLARLQQARISFCRSNRSRVPSFFTTMYGISSIRS